MNDNNRMDEWLRTPQYVNPDRRKAIEVNGPDEDMDTDENQNCGCPPDYHLSDCPHRTGDYGPSTKQAWIEIMSDPNYDDDEGGY